MLLQSAPAAILWVHSYKGHGLSSLAFVGLWVHYILGCLLTLPPPHFLHPFLQTTHLLDIVLSVILYFL